MNNNRYDYLISWFHPTEYTVEMDGPYWVTGRNEDFGFETRCAQVRATDPESAKQFILSYYDMLGFPLTFRFCKQQNADSLPAITHLNLLPASMAA